MRPRNNLLARLSDDEYGRLRPYLRTVALQPRQVLHRQGGHLQFVYFPNGGVVSMATLLADGSMVETATIGDDGMVGIEAFFSNHAVSACETVVQTSIVHDSAERISVEDFRRELATLPGLRDAVASAIERLYGVMTRLMACNAHHSVDQRCARWLLTMDDRMNGHELHLSHELLAAMLGVRRQSITVVAGTLRAAGVIQYVHGRIKILDRARLEAATCDCYTIIRTLYERMKS